MYDLRALDVFSTHGALLHFSTALRAHQKVATRQTRMRHGALMADFALEKVRQVRCFVCSCRRISRRISTRRISSRRISSRRISTCNQRRHCSARRTLVVSVGLVLSHTRGTFDCLRKMSNQRELLLLSFSQLLKHDRLLLHLHTQVPKRWCARDRRR